MCNLLGQNHYHFLVITMVLISWPCIFRFIICYSLTLLVLNHRGNTIFQHSVNQLQRFLKAERVDNNIISHAVNHFRYWWLRFTLCHYNFISCQIKTTLTDLISTTNWTDFRLTLYGTRSNTHTFMCISLISVKPFSGFQTAKIN